MNTTETTKEKSSQPKGNIEPGVNVAARFPGATPNQIATITAFELNNKMILPTGGLPEGMVIKTGVTEGGLKICTVYPPGWQGDKTLGEIVSASVDEGIRAAQELLNKFSPHSPNSRQPQRAEASKNSVDSCSSVVPNVADKMQKAEEKHTKEQHGKSPLPYQEPPTPTMTRQ